MAYFRAWGKKVATTVKTRSFAISLLAAQFSMILPALADPAPDGADFQELVVEARQTLDNTLIDYPSARFRNVFPLVWHEGKGLMNLHPKIYPAFCGEMNARNRMGGYGGWEPFFLAPRADSYRRLISGNLAYQWCSAVPPSVAAETADIDWSAKLTYSVQVGGPRESSRSGGQ